MPSSPPSASGAEAVVLSKASAAKDSVQSWLCIPFQSSRLRAQASLGLLSYAGFCTIRGPTVSNRAQDASCIGEMLKY